MIKGFVSPYILLTILVEKALEKTSTEVAISTHRRLEDGKNTKYM